MATKRKPKSEPILNSEPLTSRGVIVTHPERHITPGNASITWLIVMMAIVGAVGALATYIWWQKEDLSNQIEAPYAFDNGHYTRSWMFALRDRMMGEPEEAMDTSRSPYYHIEDWRAYQRIDTTSGSPLSISCTDKQGKPDETLNKELVKVMSGPMSALTLPGDYKLVVSTRPATFPLEAITNGNCAELGSSMILHAYNDNLLWAVSNTCGGVAFTKDEDPDGTKTKELSDCQRSHDIVSSLFGQK